MTNRIPQTAWRWRVAHFILYLVGNGDETYWAYHVPLSDGGGRLIDLSHWLDPEDCPPNSNRYTREQVFAAARKTGHTDEQIEAAILLADIGSPIDQHDLAQCGDEEYERVLRNARRRIRLLRKRLNEEMSHGDYQDY
jgi:hypothetical protein